MQVITCVTFLYGRCLSGAKHNQPILIPQILFRHLTWISRAQHGRGVQGTLSGSRRRHDNGEADATQIEYDEKSKVPFPALCM